MSFLKARTTEFRNEFAWILIAVMVSAFISLFLSLQFGFMVLVFLAAAWWVWEHPEEGFLWLILAAPILPMLKITQTIGTTTLIKDVIILTLFLKTFLWPLLMKKLPYRRNLFVAPIIVLLSWTALEVLRADSVVLGILRARDISLYMFLYFGVLYLPHSKIIMKTRARWAVMGLLAIMLLGVYQWFFAVESAVLRFDPVREIWIPRLSSVMAHPSIFGQYLVVAVFLMGSSLFYLKKKGCLLLGVLILTSVLFIFLTYSRAVWLGLMAGGGLMLVSFIGKIMVKKVSWKLLSRMLITGGIVLVLVSAVIYQFTPVGLYVRSAIDPTYGSNEERIEFLVRLIAPLTNKEAMIGKGLGDVLAQNFREVDLSTYEIVSGEARSVQLTKNRTLVDNQYLKTFIEMGLAGLLIYAWIYWVFLKSAWQKISSDDSQQKIIAWWGLGFLAAFVVQASFIDIWDIWPTNAMFWTIAAIVSNSKVRGGT